jgi:hypothetical protein
MSGVMKRLSWMLTFLAALLLYPDLVTAISSVEILRKADQARGNLQGVTWELMVKSKERDRTSSMTLEAKARGFDILTQSLAPPKYKGNKILMIRGNMWFHRPGLSKPVPVSRRQKLLGNAAYGDIVATNYAADYAPTRLDDEIVNGEICYVFNLKSKKKNTTYDGIMYWISKERLVGIKAEYYTVSEKMFKSAVMEYENRVTIDGAQRLFISRMIISDELLTDDTTTLNFARPNLQELPDYIFDLNLLRR